MTSLLAFLSAAFAVAGMGDLLPQRAQRDRLGGGRAARLMRALAVAGAALRRMTGARAPLSLEQRIAAAGSPAGLGPRELIAAQLTTMLCGAGAGTLLGAGGAGPPPTPGGWWGGGGPARCGGGPPRPGRPR